MSRQTSRTAAVNFDLAACGESEFDDDSTDITGESDNKPLVFEQIWSDEVGAFSRAHIVAGATPTGVQLPDDLWLELLVEIDAEQRLTVEEYEQIKHISYQRDTHVHCLVPRSNDLELESAIIADEAAQEYAMSKLDQLA